MPDGLPSCRYSMQMFPVFSQSHDSDFSSIFSILRAENMSASLRSLINASPSWMSNFLSRLNLILLCMISTRRDSGRHAVGAHCPNRVHDVFVECARLYDPAEIVVGNVRPL